MTGQKFFFYCAFLAVAVSSVIFGLDWMSAPMPPMPETKNLVFVAPPPPAPPAPVVASQPSSQPSSQAPNQSPSQPSIQSQTAIQAATSPAAPAPTQSAEPDTLPPLASVVAPPRPKCDIDACAAAYRSFRESDCTYNPSYGPRRLCTKGVVPTETGATPTTTDAAAASDAKCNVDACAAAYRTFDATDCTYRSGNGLRKLCTK